MGRRRQLREAFPWDEAPRYLIHDRDHAFDGLKATAKAPEAISRDADILVLGRHGYETAVKCKNGFVCVVERGRMGHPMANCR
jgi:hypothetical protein